MNKTKHASEIASKMNLSFTPNYQIQQFNANLNANQSNQEQQVRLNTEQLINQLFIAIKAICPAWASAWPTQEINDGAKKQWLGAFIENGVQDWSKIELGLKKLKLRESPFVPAVGEFIALCTPEAQDLGLLPEQEAYELACRDAYHLSYNPSAKTNSPPEVYHAIRKIGANKLLQAKEELGRAMFARAYKDTVADVLSGRELILPPVAVIAKQTNPIDPDLRSKRIKQLKKMLGA